MFKKIKNSIRKHFQDNFVVYFTMMIFLIIGICIGAITIKILNIQQKNELISFLNSFFKVIHENDLDSLLLLKYSLSNNLKTILIIWITGMVVIGIPIIPIVVLLRGFALGFTVGFLVNELGIRGFLFALFAILPQNIFVIPGLISISSIGVAFSINSIKSKKSRIVRHNFLSDAVNYSIFIFTFSLVIFVGSLVEAYITPIFMKFISQYVY